MNGLYKDKLVFDTTAVADSDSVGAFVRASDGTLITHTTHGAKEQLDVALSAEHDEDTAHVSGDRGIAVWAVRNDAGTAMAADGDYSPFQTDSEGRLRVSADFTADFDFVYDEDSAHSDTDPGAHMLAVRQDTLASSVSADGDYASLKLNSRGGLWSVPVGSVDDDDVDSEYPVKVGSRSEWGLLPALSADGDRADLISDKYRRAYANTGSNIAANNQAVVVDDEAAVLLAAGSQLDGRRTYMVQNLGNRPIYIGKDVNVTTANGLRVAAGATLSVELGQDVALYAISTNDGQDVRLFELA
jgi:hypothetical protein